MPAIILLELADAAHRPRRKGSARRPRRRRRMPSPSRRTRAKGCSRSTTRGVALAKACLASAAASTFSLRCSGAGLARRGLQRHGAGCGGHRRLSPRALGKGSRRAAVAVAVRTAVAVAVAAIVRHRHAACSASALRNAAVVHRQRRLGSSTTTPLAVRNSSQLGHHRVQPLHLAASAPPPSAVFRNAPTASQLGHHAQRTSPPSSGRGSAGTVRRADGVAHGVGAARGAGRRPRARRGVRRGARPSPPRRAISSHPSRPSTSTLAVVDRLGRVRGERGGAAARERREHAAGPTPRRPAREQRPRDHLDGDRRRRRGRLPLPAATARRVSWGWTAIVVRSLRVSMY